MAVIVGGSLLYALATCIFIIPNNVVLGGTSGLSIILQHFFVNISSEQFITIFNVLLMILAFAILGRKVAFGTFFGSLFTTLFVFVLDFWDFSGVMINPIVATLVGAGLIGVASSILFFNDASSGGTDIIALIIKNFSKIDISKALFISDIVLALASFLVYGVKGGLLSLFGFLVKLITLALIERRIKEKKNMIFTKRPEEKRSDREEKVYDILESLNIDFERIDHETANTIADCKKIEGELGCEICKNLFLCNRQQTEFYLLLMKGDKRFVTKDFSKTIGVSRLSFASEENLLKYLNVTPGSASIFGLMFDFDKTVKLYIDKDVADEVYFGCHPCQNTTTLKVKTKDIFEKFLPHISVSANIIEIGDEALENLSCN